MIKEKRQGREADFEEKELEKRLLANLKDVEDVLERELKDIEIIN